MRIRELKLIRYGKFSDRTLALPSSAKDIHFIVGPNEAGKSTVRRAIGDWLFGIPTRTPLAFLHPMPELRVGGVLEKLPSNEKLGQQLAFDRVKGNKNTLRTPEDEILPDTVLQPWIGNMQAQAFNRMYALDHTTLIEGGAGILSASDDIGQMLFQSASGVEHLGGALKKLQEEADALWAPRRSSTRAYYKALDAYDSAALEFKQATLRTKDWRAQHDTLETTATELTQARKQDVDIRRARSRLERIRRVRPSLIALDAARAQHEELLAAGVTPLLPEDATQILSDARQAMVIVEADLARLGRELSEAQLELENTNVDRTVLSLAADIVELNERRLQFRAHRTDMVKRSEEIRMLWLRVQELSHDLGWSIDDEDSVRQRLPATAVRSRLVRLLKERPTLTQQLRTAQDSLAERQQQLEQTKQTLERLEAGAVHPELASAVELALKLGDHATAMSDVQHEIEALAQKIDAGLASLGTWRMAPTELIGMVVPDLALIKGLIDHQHRDTAEAQSQRDAIEKKNQDIDRLKLELEQLMRDFQPVSKDQVLEARRVRDAAWHEIRLEPQKLNTRTVAFESHIGNADKLADARLDRAQHDAARQSMTAQLEKQHLEKSNLESRLQTVQSRINTQISEWHDLAGACGLPLLPLEMAPAWTQQRKGVLDLLTQEANAKRRLTVGLETAARIQQTLWTMLDTEARSGPTPNLAECLRRARARLTAADQAQGQRNALGQQLDEGRKSLLTLRASVQLAQGAWEAWRQSWQAAVLAAGYEAVVPADQVEAEIDVMQEVETLLARIRAVRSERIDTMQADLDGLENSARSLAVRIAPQLENHSGEDIAAELGRRLEETKQAVAAFDELRTRVNQKSEELAAAQKSRVSVHASLAHLMTDAGTDDIRALGHAIERSNLRHEVERKIQIAQTDLTTVADGLPVEELRTEISGIDPDALKAQLEGLEALSGEIVGKIADLSNKHGTQKTAFEAFDGADVGARAEARRQEAISAMGDAAEHYLKLHTACRILKWSMEKFRETKQGPMLTKASSIFSGLTLGSFSRLLVDSDGATPRLFGVRPNGEQVDVSGMSEGSRDQLYLALRLASLDLQIEQGLSMPLIADDLFINFDDSRTAAGLKVLGELSRKVQVVFLTHHDHLLPLAKEVLGHELSVVYL